MKTDQEFLQGVYEKAEEFKADETNANGFMHNKEKGFIAKYAGIVVAAVAAIVILPSLYMSFNKNYAMVQPAQSTNRAMQASPQIAGFDLGSSEQTLAEQCDLVVIAKVQTIEKSVYETDDIDNNNMTTTVNFKTVELLDGSSENKKFKVIVNGGYDPKTSNFIPYEAFFTKGDIKLLFLTKLNQDEYTLTNSEFGVYTKANEEENDEVFYDKYGNTITKQEIMTIIL